MRATGPQRAGGSAAAAPVLPEMPATANKARPLPVEWHRGVAELKRMQPVADWPTLPWLRLQAALPGFMTSWAPAAAALGWCEFDVFGCHPRAPFARLDLQGLALGLSNFVVLAIGEEGATVTLPSAHPHRLTWRRRPPVLLAGSVALWEVKAGR